MGYAVEHDTSGNYYCSRKTDIMNEKLTQAALSIPAIPLFQCYAKLQCDSSIPRQAVHIKPCVGTGTFSFFCFNKAWNY